MKTSQNTILITGGSAGIGFAIAKLLGEQGNHIIITGRDEQRLNKALLQLPNATAIVSDVSKEEDTSALVERIKKDFPTLNIVVNNAGKAFLYDISSSEDAFGKAGEEMLTNYLSVIRLNEQLLPLLKSQKDAAIVNVSSIVAIVPGKLTTYSASKAALHSYTQSLRGMLQNSNVKVFELMPPLVDTEFSTAINGKTGISAAQVASDLLQALKDNQYEIRVGKTQYVYDLYLKNPEEAFNLMNTN